MSQRRMARETANVKQRVLDWLCDHPYTGWYIAVIATLNLILNFIDAFNIFK